MCTKRNILTAALVTLLVLAFGLAAMPAEATGQDTCPHTGDWVKVDDLDGFSYTYNAPDGKLIDGACYKHSTYVHQYDVSPPAESHTVSSDYHLVCNPWWNCRFQRYELSHASFHLIDGPQDEPTPTATEEPTEEPTPEDTPTEEPTPEDTPTEEPTQEPTEELTQQPTEEPITLATTPECRAKRLGMLFTLIGPEGQVGYLASYQVNPNTGTWSLPSAEAQQQCLGWVAVNAPNGDVIEIGCDGTINIICRRCIGGGPDEAYGDN